MSATVRFAAGMGLSTGAMIPVLAVLIWVAATGEHPVPGVAEVAIWAGLPAAIGGAVLMAANASGLDREKS